MLKVLQSEVDTALYSFFFSSNYEALDLVRTVVAA